MPPRPRSAGCRRSRPTRARGGSCGRCSRRCCGRRSASPTSVASRPRASPPARTRSTRPRSRPSSSRRWSADVAAEIRIPPLGESVNEATIVRWLKDDGAHVEADEVVLELETEKAAMEVQAETAGRLSILVPAGSRVQPGAVVGRITEEAAAARKDATPERKERAPAATEAAADKDAAPREAPRKEAPREAVAAARPAASPRPAAEAPRPEPARAPARDAPPAPS